MKNDKGHNIVERTTWPHEGQHWYECTECHRTDWIASYGDIGQLSFFNEPCVPSDIKQCTE